MLVDASCLNRMALDLRAYFEKKLGRALPKADVALLFEALWSDVQGEIEAGDTSFQVFLVYEPSDSRLAFAARSDLAGELNGVGVKGAGGEYAFYSFSTEGLATRESLFADLLKVIGESGEQVRHLVLLPEDKSDSRFWTDYLEKNPKMKPKVSVLGMVQNPEWTDYPFHTVGYALMAAFGIRPDEL